MSATPKSPTPGRGFIKQTVAPPTPPSYVPKEPTPEPDRRSSRIDASAANSIRSIQEKIQSEFRKEGRGSLPLAKGVEEDKQRTSSDVVKARVQNIETTLKVSPAPVPSPRQTPPNPSPRAMPRQISPPSDNYNRPDPTIRADASAHRAAPTPTNNVQHNGVWHNKSMLSSITDAFGLGSGPSPKSVSEVDKRSSYPGSGRKAQDSEPEEGLIPRDKSTYQKRPSYIDITEQSIKKQDVKIDLKKVRSSMIRNRQEAA